eukprot:CAMPEP_0202890174 /NCGR_PEP_ID=MMETSP1392-20130828/675_1 /ASSEMBLY_ACC=CAM_ASM_000868 /TAXON_ID=225041 /ORGANISM="Chlamydomonas chlamydogama, Strain SAG 11-48b" /LENGTH=435 /DNA_ID=CAMNT_0049573703 /DNA_START=82 /DNA_END=1389 /DNA_ORIENTATION=-
MGNYMGSVRKENQELCPTNSNNPKPSGSGRGKSRVEKDNSGMLRIHVNDVEVNHALVKKASVAEVLASTLKSSKLGSSCGEILACSHELKEDFAALADKGLNNHLVLAVHLAFAQHYPLVLTPDAIWVTILQGLSAHINSDPEKYRKLLVAHEGKKELLVIDDAMPVDWPFFATELAKLAQGNVVNAKLSEAMSLKFSTTGPIEQTAFSMVLMDTLKAYFEYRCWTRCGIPYIKLGGTRSDWETMAQHLSCLDDFGLKEWRKQLQYVLAEFVAAFDGNINQDFWSGIYKWNGPAGSGQVAYITGWLTTLFPYLGSGKPNPAVWKSDVEKVKQPLNKSRPPWAHGGRPADSIPCTDLPSVPSSVTATPVTHILLVQEYKRMFLAGVLGVKQCSATFALQPVVGWAVAEAKEGAECDSEEEFYKMLKEHVDKNLFKR